MDLNLGLIEFKTIVEMLDLNPKDKLLDVGSGDGYWTNKFSSLDNFI